MPYKDTNIQKQYVHDHYLKNKELVRERSRNRRKEAKKWFYDNFILNKKCKYCPENNPVCLEHHHRDPSLKVAEVPVMVREFRNKNKIIEEINKCDLICSNCHRKIHAGIKL